MNEGASMLSGMGERLHLRAASEPDRAFLYSVFESTRADEFARAGLSADRIAALLAQQFSMQDAYYRTHYPHGSFDVVMLGNERVGRLYHDWRAHEARLIDIALLPAYRGAGLGTKLMNAFVAQAAAKAIPIVLYVEMENPVQALYRRLGFEAVGENGVYIQMRREVAPYAGADVTSVAGLALD
ncbi:GNAT family N-acetyltransferase [Trinickia sp. NRRL B-1857]|uniref:GNAT family N-acetyltransferase n=1 Tax=Trinickia sp. NRRL B-1857 TaxID=3162879 RepID=UPI003D2DB46E